MTDADDIIFNLLTSLIDEICETQNPSEKAIEDIQEAIAYFKGVKAVTDMLNRYNNLSDGWLFEILFG